MGIRTELRIDGDECRRCSSSLYEHGKKISTELRIEDDMKITKRVRSHAPSKRVVPKMFYRHGYSVLGRASAFVTDEIYATRLRFPAGEYGEGPSAKGTVMRKDQKVRPFSGHVSLA